MRVAWGASAEDVLHQFGRGSALGLAAIRRRWEDATIEQPIGHHVGNVIITESEDGTAHVRSKRFATLTDGRAGTVVYDDVMVRTAAGWRIARRTVIAPRK